jgi:hypothetical protein
MNDRQLELGLGIKRELRARSFRKTRSARGHEWFERMRQLVENAPDRKFEGDETQKEQGHTWARAA